MSNKDAEKNISERFKAGANKTKNWLRFTDNTSKQSSVADQPPLVPTPNTTNDTTTVPTAPLYKLTSVDGKNTLSGVDKGNKVRVIVEGNVSDDFRVEPEKATVFVNDTEVGDIAIPKNDNPGDNTVVNVNTGDNDAAAAADAKTAKDAVVNPGDNTNNNTNNTNNNTGDNTGDANNNTNNTNNNTGDNDAADADADAKTGDNTNNNNPPGTGGSRRTARRGLRKTKSAKRRVRKTIRRKRV